MPHSLSRPAISGTSPACQSSGRCTRARCRASPAVARAHAEFIFVRDCLRDDTHTPSRGRQTTAANNQSVASADTLPAATAAAAMLAAGSVIGARAVAEVATVGVGGFSAPLALACWPFPALVPPPPSPASVAAERTAAGEDQGARGRSDIVGGQPGVDPRITRDMALQAHALPSRTGSLRRRLSAVAYLQGSLATIQVVSGDFINALVSGVMCASGCYASTPRGSGFLPTYIVLTLLNGSLALIVASSDLVQASAAHIAYLSFANRISVNVTHFGTIALPVLAFLAVWQAYDLYRELRSSGFMWRGLDFVGQEEGSERSATQGQAPSPAVRWFGGRRFRLGETDESQHRKQD